jgi:hypothetical protein
MIHPRAIHWSFMLFHLVVSDNKLSLICLTFTRTLNQFHFTPLLIFTLFRSFVPFRISVSWSPCFCRHACLLGSSNTVDWRGTGGHPNRHRVGQRKTYSGRIQGTMFWYDQTRKLTCFWWTTRAMDGAVQMSVATCMCRVTSMTAKPW